MRCQQRGVEFRTREDPLDVFQSEFGDLNLGVGMRWNESAQARVVLPIEGSADDDGVEGGPSAPYAHLLDEALDKVERAGTPAGHGAHCIELIDDQHRGAPSGLCRRREHECRGFFEIEASTELQGRRQCRGHPIEPEREDWEASLSQLVDEFDDEGTLAGTGASGDDPVPGRIVQIGEQRCDCCVGNEFVADEPTADRHKVPVGSAFHGKGGVLRCAQGSQMETARFDLPGRGRQRVHLWCTESSTIVRSASTMGVGGPRKRALTLPAHFLVQFMLINHSNVNSA